MRSRSSRGIPVPVSLTSITTSPRAPGAAPAFAFSAPSPARRGAKRNGAGRWRVLERVRQQARSGPGGAAPGRLRRSPRARRRARHRPRRGRPAPASPPRSRARRRRTSTSLSPTASIRARVSSESVRRLTRSTSSDSRREEVVAGVRIVLGAGAQDLDRARDAGDRVAELVCGIGDELALGELPAQLLRSGRGRRAGPRSRPPARAPIAYTRSPTRSPSLLGRRRAATPAAATGRAPRSALPVRSRSAAPRRRSRTAPRRTVRHDHHRLVERVEDRRQAVALARQHPERSRAARPASTPAPSPELADLVPPPGRDRGSSSRPSVSSPALVASRFRRTVNRLATIEADQDGDRDRHPERGEAILLDGLERPLRPRAGAGAGEQRPGELAVAEHRHRDVGDLAAVLAHDPPAAKRGADRALLRPAPRRGRPRAPPRA